MTGDTNADSGDDADALMVRGADPPSQRTRLGRAMIVDTAVVFVDSHGLRELSMRRLGAELEVEAMALYRYVAGREELLDAVVARVLDDMHDDAEVLTVPQDGWQDFLVRLAHGLRRVALAHPGVFPLVASRPTEAPWIRPPLRSLVWVERFLDGLLAEGFSDAAAITAYRSFTGFLLGHLLLEVSGLGADISPLDVLDDGDEDEGDGLAPYPNVRRLGDGLSQDHSATEFEASLEQLVDRLTLVRATAD